MREALAAGVLEGAEPRAGEPDFVFTRVFAAPRELLFRAMTEAAHLGRWFGPAGMGLRVVSSELRPGGQFRYAMTGGPADLFGRFVYREVTAPARLAYVVSFTDEAGAPVRHPLSPGWPLEVLSVLTLTELDGRTLLFARSLPLHAPLEERQTFLAGHPSMGQGVGGMYDRLDAYLTTLG
ncbi:MAG: SRPBCC domain-containing protein [Deltaproteobacteria bacterium]|nr:SRPBCC domain-containing protein [Deltaproteobacteria bacterium]